MPYESIPHVGATYLDGSFREPTPSGQPRIIVLASSTSGLTYEYFRVSNVRRAEVEFGATTPLMKGVHEVLAQGADNAAVMRIGGRQGTFVHTDNASATLTITTEYRDDDILGRYALAISNDGSVNRIGVYDLIDEEWVYDSAEILVINQGIVDVVDTGIELCSVGSFTDVTQLIALDTLVRGDFSPTVPGNPVCTEGTDGTAMSLIELYTALNTGYHLLDFRDADFIYAPEAFFDAPNLAMGDTGSFFKGPPVAGDTNDVLGYVWQYIYEGKLYTYFVDADDFFTQEATAVASTVTLANNPAITLTAQKTGTGGDNISITIIDPLADAIALANGLKTSMNAHAADAVEHKAADVVNFPVVAAGATDLASLLTLTTALLIAYDAHEADMELPAGGTYHDAQVALVTDNLVSAVAPTTLAQAVTRLTDLKAKYNLHDADATGHDAGSQHQNATAAIGGTGALTSQGLIVVDITEPDGDSILITVDLGNSAPTQTAIVTAVDAELAATTLANGLTADTYVAIAGAGAGGVKEANTPLAGGAGAHVVTHADMTGDTIPSEVTTAFSNGTDAELREVNFGHQLASFCHFASQTWKTLLGAINFKAPTSWSRSAIATWVGQPAVYTLIEEAEAIDTSGENGTGLLGNKFLAGLWDTTGYRNHMVPGGDASDGYAYGGLIATAGASLPNGGEHAYGILDTDELLDDGGAPVDIGKHLFVCYDWPVHRNAYAGGTTYRGQLAGSLLGKLATLPPNREPIGANGVLKKITAPPKIHSTQLDALAKIRTVGTRFEEGTGYIIVSAKTAAHPDSDYIRSSTIRCVNREVDGIRRIAKKFLGEPYSPQSIVALQAAIDGYLQAERLAGYNQGAVAPLYYTRTDKILGRLEIHLRMVPPFSIESVDVTIALAAEESEL